MSRARRVAGATLAGMTLGLIGCAVFAGAASATTETMHKTMQVASMGAFGWSCPEGTVVVAGSGQISVNPDSVTISAPMAPNTQYPHYKTGVHETGWYVVNGATAQEITITFECASVATEPTTAPTTSLAPTTAPTQTPNCEPAYIGVCLPPFTGVDNINCNDSHILVSSFPLVDPNKDPYKLDQDGVKGIACENNGKPPYKAPSATPSIHASVVPVAQPSLPVTGNNVPALVAIAAGVIGFGVSLVYLGKRRRKIN